MSNGIELSIVRKEIFYTLLERKVEREISARKEKVGVETPYTKIPTLEALAPGWLTLREATPKQRLAHDQEMERRWIRDIIEWEWKVSEILGPATFKLLKLDYSAASSRRR